MTRIVPVLAPPRRSSRSQFGKCLYRRLQPFSVCGGFFHVSASRLHLIFCSSSFSLSLLLLSLLSLLFIGPFPIANVHGIAPCFLLRHANSSLSVFIDAFILVPPPHSQIEHLSAASRSSYQIRLQPRLCSSCLHAPDSSLVLSCFTLHVPRCARVLLESRTFKSTFRLYLRSSYQPIFFPFSSSHFLFLSFFSSSFLFSFLFRPSVLFPS